MPVGLPILIVHMRLWQILIRQFAIHAIFDVEVGGKDGAESGALGRLVDLAAAFATEEVGQFAIAIVLDDKVVSFGDLDTLDWLHYN